ncbi:MAG: GldG family protein, partial [Gemmiger qucibialis]
MNFKKKNAANAPAPNQAQQAARRRSLRSGAYASVLAVVVLVLVILLNLVVGAVPTKFTQFDISTGKMFTLSDTTKTMLQELNTDVTAYYLAETGNEDSNITRILDRYAGESSHFTWQQRDPALYPTFAQQYDAQNASSSSVILVCGDNHTVVDYNDMYTADYSSYYTTGSYTMSFSAENALSSGIAKVTRENSYVLYQLTGHGEASLESDFTETLDNSGVTVQDLNLLTNDTVPEDAAALLINDPQADLSTLDAAAIKTYLENGGHLFVTTDLTVSTPNLDALLAEYGMTRQEGLVIE